MRRFRLILFILTIFLLSACSPSSEISSLSPPPDAKEFWTYITSTNPYTQWQHWPGYEGKNQGISPNGAFFELYGNDIAVNAARRGLLIMPYGSILVKENYARDKEMLLSVTSMYKLQGYNSNAGDWYWVKYSPQGKARGTGSVQACIRCHAAARDFRYIHSQ